MEGVVCPRSGTLAGAMAIFQAVDKYSSTHTGGRSVASPNSTHRRSYLPIHDGTQYETWES